MSAGTSTAVSVTNVDFLAEDMERYDLSRSHAEKRDQMLDEMLSWIETVDAKIPNQHHPNYQSRRRSH